MEKTFTKEEMKTLAVKRLQQLDCYKPYLNAFKNHNIITEYESFGGYYIDEDSELYAKIKEVENDGNLMVYAVIHNMLEFGECYSMLCVSKYPEEEEAELEEYDGYGKGAFAMVWNKSQDFVEGGTVGVQQKYGGLIRTF